MAANKYIISLMKKNIGVNLRNFPYSLTQRNFSKVVYYDKCGKYKM